MSRIFVIQDKKLSTYLMIIQELDLQLFINQNRTKQQEQDLKHLHLNKCFKDYQ